MTLFESMPAVLLTSQCYCTVADAMKVCFVMRLLHDCQVRSLCLSPLGGVPASFLSSQQSSSEALAVKNELRKVLKQP
jgi:acid phosphatase family membrane protein YuiD